MNVGKQIPKSYNKQAIAMEEDAHGTTLTWKPLSEKYLTSKIYLLSMIDGQRYGKTVE